MKKYHEAISDCDSALLIDPKCTKSITQKGNALLGLKRYDEAKECYESLKSLGEKASAENLLKKLHDAQETDFQRDFFLIPLWSPSCLKNPQKLQKPNCIMQIPKTKKSKRKQK